MNFDLREYREKAGISQKDLSKMVKISQSQYSRYEKDPSIIPWHVMKRLSAILGFSLDEVGTEDGKNDYTPNWNRPYKDLYSDISFIHKYLNHLDDEVKTEGTEEILANLKQFLDRSIRKPKILLTGAFDAAKSHIVNELVGDDILPTGYTPMTRLLTYVMHVDERPEFINSDALICTSGFGLDDLYNQDKLNKHLVKEGSHSVLKEFSGEVTGKNEIEVAVVFLEAKILEGATIIDTPGFEDTSDDDQLAQKAAKDFDILIYTSRAAGFLGQEDITRLGYYLDNFQLKERLNSPKDPLDGIYVVATHAHERISDYDLKNIKDKGAKRWFTRNRDNKLKRFTEFSGSAMNVRHLRKRIFSFWSELPHRSEELVQNLHEVLCVKYPNIKESRFEKAYKKYQKDVPQKLQNELALAQKTLNERKKLRDAYKKAVEREPERKREVKKKKDFLYKKMDEAKASSFQQFSKKYRERIQVERIKSTIQEKFDNKKEAQKGIVGYLADNLNGDLKETIESLWNEELQQPLDEFLEDYETLTDLNEIDPELNFEVKAQFDSRAAFVGGLVGLAGIGALSVWASTLGALGGYIVTAKLYSLLTALGISFGSSAAVSALVAALGGPVAIFVALGALAAFVGYILSGESWQSRLAKKVVKEFENQNVEDKFQSKINEVWEETKIAFDHGSRKVEEEYQDWLAELETLAYEDDSSLKEKISKLEKQLSFFENLPSVS